MKAQELIKEFKRHNMGPYIEVPCSILASVISRLEKDDRCEVLNPANEAVAMGLAAGSYLATKKIPVALMQNSGLFNTLNALTSLHQIYLIPMLYLISWRGEPDTKDAPEHEIIGIKLKGLLNILRVPYIILSEKNFKEEVRKIIKTIEETKRPAALILKDGLIEDEKKTVSTTSSGMTKEKAIDIIINISYGKVCLITTNGFISREVFHNLNINGKKTHAPFYMLGSMGHALSIGMGLAKYAKTNKKVLVLDGDGGCLMHLGSMASIDDSAHSRLIHVVLDDGVYASTGGQRTLSGNINLCRIAGGCGYKNVYKFENEGEFKKTFPDILDKKGPTFIHITLNSVEGTEAPRVSGRYSCEEIKERFMDNLTV